MRAIISLLVIVSVACGININARRERTTQPIKTSSQSGSSHTVSSPYDIVITPGDSIPASINMLAQLSGYDKPVNSSRESMHVTNLSDSLAIVAMTVHLQYLDSQGRELHQRDVELYERISPSHTELVTFPTWDIQRSFYYILSTHPRRQATPYDLSATITSLTLQRDTTTTTDL